MMQNNTAHKAEGTIAEMSNRVFCIQQTKEMMDILSKNMYSMPEKAVSRELLCNAYDSTVARGGEYRPIEVHCPNILEPFFSVRDYGTGLSDEDVQTLYTTYGASTKRNTNSQIGGFGIGSKSPFAITDSFTVVSYFKGRKMLYQCYKSKGLPYITKISDEATTEPEGLFVSVPIANVCKFITDLKGTLLGFNRSDISLTGYSNSLKYFDEAFEFSGVEHLYKSKKVEYYSETYVKMGKVLYRINVSNSPGLLLDYPIGTFEIAASRETLYESEEVSNKLKQFIKELGEKYREHFRTIVPPIITTFEEMEKLSSDYHCYTRGWCDGLKVLGKYTGYFKPLAYYYTSSATTGKFTQRQYIPRGCATSKDTLRVRVKYGQEINLELLKKFAKLKKFKEIVIWHALRLNHSSMMYRPLGSHSYIEYEQIDKELSQLKKTFERQRKARLKWRRNLKVPKETAWKDATGNLVSNNFWEDCKCFVYAVQGTIDWEDNQLLCSLVNKNLLKQWQVLKVNKTQRDSIPKGLMHIKEFSQSQEIKDLIKEKEKPHIKKMHQSYKIFVNDLLKRQSLSNFLTYMCPCKVYKSEYLTPEYKERADRYERLSSLVEHTAHKFYFYKELDRTLQYVLKDTIIKRIKKELASEKELDKLFRVCYR